ncbi:hypothetical protein VB005_00907 [Metarhizium brunneum]
MHGNSMFAAEWNGPQLLSAVVVVVVVVVAAVFAALRLPIVSR